MGEWADLSFHLLCFFLALFLGLRKHHQVHVESLDLRQSLQERQGFRERVTIERVDEKESASQLGKLEKERKRKGRGGSHDRVPGNSGNHLAKLVSREGFLNHLRKFLCLDVFQQLVQGIAVILHLLPVFLKLK